MRAGVQLWTSGGNFPLGRTTCERAIARQYGGGPLPIAPVRRVTISCPPRSETMQLHAVHDANGELVAVRSLTLCSYHESDRALLLSLMGVEARR